MRSAILACVLLVSFCFNAFAADESPQAKTETIILNTIDKACADSWCEVGDVYDIQFNKFRCSTQGCVLYYTVIQEELTSANGAQQTRSVRTCQLEHVKSYQDAMASNGRFTGLSDTMYWDVDSCLHIAPRL